MKRGNHYRIRIEEETHLRTVSDVKLTPIGLTLLGIGVVALMIIVAGAVIVFTPIRTLLPGYMKESQRAATEEGLLRLDSLQDAFGEKQAYIDNYLRVIDETRLPSDSSAMARQEAEETEDTLITATERERKFVDTMKERERFNISVLAPLAADGIMFSPVNPSGVFTADSRDSELGKVLLPQDAPIQSLADGAVIAVYYSASDHGFTVLTQHQRGFVTSISKAGTPMVGTGDDVSGGQVVAANPSPDSRGRRMVEVRMWHNGLPVVPYKYIGYPVTETDSELESYEAPRGRF